jgi:hypothetical protein
MSKNNLIKGGALDPNIRCAANIEYSEGSCFSIEQLKLLAYTYNKAIEKKKIDGDQIKIIDNKSFLLNQINDRLKDCKGNQLCWIKQKFNQSTKELDPDEIFRPDGTDGKTEWLGTNNIDDVMHQIERKFSDYLFLGATPVDFQEINYNNIAKLNFDDLLINGYKDKNEMMVEYNLKKLYLKNIKLIEAINIFNGKQNRYPFKEFYNDVINIDNNKLLKHIEQNLLLRQNQTNTCI